jgi:hypothetical protein
MNRVINLLAFYAHFDESRMPYKFIQFLILSCINSCAKSVSMIMKIMKNETRTNMEWPL